MLYLLTLGYLGEFIEIVLVGATKHSFIFSKDLIHDLEGIFTLFFS